MNKRAPGGCPQDVLRRIAAASFVLVWLVFIEPVVLWFVLLTTDRDDDGDEAGHQE